MRWRSVDQMTGAKRYFLANGHQPVLVGRILSSIAPSDSARLPAMSSFLTIGSVLGDLCAHPPPNESTRDSQATVVANLAASVGRGWPLFAPARWFAQRRANVSLTSRGRRRSRQH